MFPDALHRAAYRTAFLGLRAWWRVRRPAKESAAVALWRGDRLLVVRTSYHPLLDLPGGGVGAGEEPSVAAARELREETGIAVPPDALGAPARYGYLDLHRRVTAHVFPWRPAEVLEPVADRREIVWAGYLSRPELAAARLSPLLQAMLKGEGAQVPSGTRQISRA